MFPLVSHVCPPHARESFLGKSSRKGEPGTSGADFVVTVMAPDSLAAAQMPVDRGRARRQDPRVLRLVDGNGFDAAVQPHHGWLRGLALRLTRSPADASDLVQDTLERGLRAWGNVTPNTNVRAWLAVILNNLFIDRCRRGSAVAAPVSLDDRALHVAQPAREPEPAWAHLGEVDVRAALAQVQADFRDVYRLHLDGLSYEAIATRLAIPRATVGTRLLRARRQLRDILEKELARG